MNTKLITALRTSANAIEQGIFAYKWSNPESCNCGVLACALTGKSIQGMVAMLPNLTRGLDENRHHWKHIAAHHCPITGIPENEVLRAMMAAGMTQSDFSEMEFLANPDAQKLAIKNQGSKAVFFTAEATTGHLWSKRTIAISTGKYNYTNKSNAVAYMRAWADILTERGALDNPEAESKPTTHREQNVREG